MFLNEDTIEKTEKVGDFMNDFIVVCIGLLLQFFLIKFIVVSIRYIDRLISFIFVTFLGGYFFGSIGAVIVGIFSFISFIAIIINDINPPKPEPTVEVIEPPIFAFFTPHKCGGCGGKMKQIDFIKTITHTSGWINSYEDTRRDHGYTRFKYKCKSCDSIGYTEKIFF